MLKFGKSVLKLSHILSGLHTQWYLLLLAWTDLTWQRIDGGICTKMWKTTKGINEDVSIIFIIMSEICHGDPAIQWGGGAKYWHEHQPICTHTNRHIHSCTYLSISPLDVKSDFNNWARNIYWYWHSRPHEPPLPPASIFENSAIENSALNSIPLVCRIIGTVMFHLFVKCWQIRHLESVPFL